MGLGKATLRWLVFFYVMSIPLGSSYTREYRTFMVNSSCLIEEHILCCVRRFLLRVVIALLLGASSTEILPVESARAQSSGNNPEMSKGYDGLEGSWDDRFIAPEADPVAKLAIDQKGTLYAAGSFRQISGIAVRGIAMYRNGQWSVPGVGPEGGIAHMAVAPNGDLIVGGSFWKLGDQPARNIARWDGRRWTTLGEGIGYNITALAVGSDGTVYASGGFHNRWGIFGTGVLRWDGKSWSSLPGGPLFVTNLMITSDGAVFSRSGNVIYTWNAEGMRWDQVTADLEVGFYIDEVIVDKDGQIFASIFHWQFDEPVGRVSALATWKDGIWHLLEEPAYERIVQDLASTPDGTLYSASEQEGRVTIKRWEGMTSQVVDTSLVLPDYGFVSLEFSPGGDLYVNGNFHSQDYSVRNLARWSGSHWENLVREGLGANGLVFKVLSDGKENFYVSGDFTRLGNVYARHIGRFDGERWWALAEGLDAPPYALALGHGGTLYAGGAFGWVGGYEPPTHNLAVWDGQRWTRLESIPCFGNPSGRDIATITALKAGSDRLYAAGRCGLISGFSAAFVAFWDGLKWIHIGTMQDNHATILALELDPEGNLYAGGAFLKADSVNAMAIAMWNGSRWSPLGSGLHTAYAASGTVLDLIWQGGKLYTAGVFELAGGVGALNVAVWNGTAWESVGSGFNGGVRALAVDTRGNLYAGGDFEWSGMEATRRIALWDGSNWKPVGSGIRISDTWGYANVLDLAVGSGASLFVTGQFEMVGTHTASRNIALWRPPSEDENEIPEPTATTISVFPNPVQGEGKLTITLLEKDRLQMGIYDLQGRKIQDVFEGTLEADLQYSFTFDVSLLSDGIYFLNITGSRENITRAILHIH